MKNRIIYTLFFAFVVNVLSSQDIANLRVGLLSTSIETSEIQSRYGYNAGISARIGIPGFFMEPSLYYENFTISSYKEKEFISDHPSFHIVKINTNAGVEYKLLKKFNLRFYLGGNLSYVAEIDKNNHDIDFNAIDYGFASYNFGIGTTIYFATLDFKYEKSLSPFFKSFENSQITSYNISLGFMF